ncbi:tetraacyldisaccharide 4'-kinase [Hymenobacter sp. ASUV-10]|uniref:Tetraacyldisaccharide 4'-kinase n=1 Tax=Hymenobacter aranciens TaxID=3063996 RepID=A0ABT9BCG7_9BACT|nr:tetraacyldisaccharide 4'-kinase [Hymenobacter sp. ASUV-10]MDO7875954.1 tetraacyldisaccharide 4'-kinase [Hymenobacter sp. ASUV-10]
MAQLLTWLLLPLSWLYAGVAAIRNWLYDIGWKKSEAFAVPLLNVGNLRVGGTGKTPHVAWLVAELLRQGHRPAILSRGYGRQTTGPRLATAADSAATIGDEPWQYFQQFSPAAVPVAVAEARRLGVRLLLAAHPEITVIVLDDAYQHRAVQPALNLLLTELVRPFYTDHVLPAGRLRESRAGARRADVVITTKCPPDLPETTRAAVAQYIRRYARPAALVLFSSYRYGPPLPLTPETPPCPAPPAAALLTGIAQPGPLRDYLESQGYRIEVHADFPDHHAFQPADLEKLRAQWQPGWPIFTTAKDATRLQAPALQAALRGLPLYIIPIETAFLADGAVQLRQRLPAPPALNL